MNKSSAPIIAFVLVTSIGSVQAWASDSLVTKMVKNYRGSTVFISATKETKTGEIIEEFGTGFIVSDQGHVLTSCHTVNRIIHDRTGRDTKKDVESVTVKGATGSREETAEPMQFIACASPPIDLALLKFKNTFKKRQPAPLDRASKLYAGDTIASMGYPIDVEFFPRRGSLGVSTGDDTYSVDMTLTVGDSGSPVFSEKLMVVGVAESGYPGTSIGFVRPIRHAAGLLSVAGIEITATNVEIASNPAPNAPSGTKVEFAEAPKVAIESFFNGVGSVPPPTGKLKVTYPFLKVFPTDSGGTSSSNIGVNDVKAKPGYKIVDARFIALSQNSAEVVNVSPAAGGTFARTTTVRDSGQPSSKEAPVIRGFVETVQIPIK